MTHTDLNDHRRPASPNTGLPGAGDFATARRHRPPLWCRAQLAELGWLRAWRGYCPGQEFDARRSARLGSGRPSGLARCRGGPPGTCSAGRRRCCSRIGPGASIGGIEYRHFYLVDRPGRVVQRVGCVVLRLLGVSLGRLHIALVAFALHPFLQRLHLGRRVGLERLPLGVCLVRRLVHLAVDGFPRGIGLCLGGGHPCLDLLVCFMLGGVQRALEVGHLGLQRSVTGPAPRASRSRTGHRRRSRRQAVPRAPWP